MTHEKIAGLLPGGQIPDVRVVRPKPDAGEVQDAAVNPEVAPDRVMRLPVEKRPCLMRRNARAVWGGSTRERQRKMRLVRHQVVVPVRPGHAGVVVLCRHHHPLAAADGDLLPDCPGQTITVTMKRTMSGSSE